MKSMSVLWVGCGDIGNRAGSALRQDGWRIAAVRRNVDRLPDAFEGYAADYTQPDSLAFAAALAPDFVVTTCSPSDRSVEGYRAGFEAAAANLLEGLGAHRPRHIIMASSTRVIAERDGGWVDEHSPLTSDDECARAIIAAEKLLHDSGHSVSIVRFAGIYGTPGGRLIARISRGEICPPRPVRYTNRIHRQDCAGFIVHLLHKAARDESLEPVYIGVDDAPAPRYEVETWLARELGVPVPDGEAPAEPVRHNSAGHKRCGNRALRDSGYRLIYPDYRSGYGALLDGVTRERMASPSR